MAFTVFLLYVLFTLVVLYHSMDRRVWEVGSAVYLLGGTFLIGLPWYLCIVVWIALIAIDVVLRVEAVQFWMSDFLFKRLGSKLPKLSKTEEEALSAGDIWLEQDIFRGTLDWDKLSHVKTALTDEEAAFLNQETETLCSMLHEWDIAQAHDLSSDVWAYLKEQGFFGLVIAKAYGGKGFSARAHSDIVLKIASRSTVAVVTAMVPNSLGPGELLQHYGTDEQKNYFLPRLAKGEEIPCFALTEPGAGSDATSIQSEAVVIEKNINGKTILGLNLTLDKRWITLAPVATLIGLAVNLRDPNGLLHGVGEEGITCLLIPRSHKNLEIGARHIPAGQPFMNGTIRGADIFVPIDSIIGGQKMAGSGWKMLVECLSIGRAISLPALGAASSAVSYITSGAFANVRRQFNVEIAQFEGIEEKLAQIAGLNYLVSATRLLTVAAVNEHKKPSVASAITKYFNTELARITINDAMDIHGGRAVVNGPRNYLANYYQSIPISITVEGANIMTRNLLIFGQGSMACHPYVKEEFYAVSSGDKQRFRTLIWQHINYFLSNLARAVGSAWTGGLFIKTPKNSLKREYKRLARLSHAFAWLADLSLICLGGSLKRKERLSARLADGLSYLYIAMAALHDYQQHESESESEYALHARWGVTYCFYHAQKSMIAFCENFPQRWLGFIVRLLMFPFGQTMRLPRDALDTQLAKVMLDNNAYRDNLLQSIYMSGDSTQPIDRIEHAFQLVLANKELYKKITDLKRCPFVELKGRLALKVEEGILTQQEMDTVITVEKARWDAIQVDEFAFDAMKPQHLHPIKQTTTPFD